MAEKPKESRLTGTLISRRGDISPAETMVPRLREKLIEELRRAKVSSLEEFKAVCAEKN